MSYFSTFYIEIHLFDPTLPKYNKWAHKKASHSLLMESIPHLHEIFCTSSCPEAGKHAKIQRKTKKLHTRYTQNTLERGIDRCVDINFIKTRGWKKIEGSINGNQRKTNETRMWKIKRATEKNWIFGAGAIFIPTPYSAPVPSSY